MENTTRPASTGPNRYLAVLPVVIDRSAKAEPSAPALTVPTSFAHPAVTLRAASDGAGAGRRASQLGEGGGKTHYGSTSDGTRWLLLGDHASETQTFGWPFTRGATYRLSLACADVFGHDGQCLNVRISGGACASKTLSIPANPFPGGALRFVNYDLYFTPISSLAVTIRLTHGTDRTVEPEILPTASGRRAHANFRW